MLLHHLVAIATEGRAPDPKEEASHLCGHTCCQTLGHVIWEEKTLNQRRKGCRVWVDCTHELGCQMKVLVCTHVPMCVKSIPETTEDQVRTWPLGYFHPPADGQTFVFKSVS